MSRSQTEVVLPDLMGRNALVTGASDGVGLEIARALAGAGARIEMPVRNRAKGERAMERIRETVPEADLVLRDLDLARLESVSALVAALIDENQPIHFLVLNAGIVMLGDPHRHETVDGDELHFQTNFLAHVALTLGLLPLLRAGSARIAVQGSVAAARFGFDWSDPQSARRYGPLRAYARSKVALGLFATELARRAASEHWGITVNQCHPGVAPDTAIAPLVRAEKSRGLSARIARGIGNPPPQAAQPALLALMTDAAPGGFYGPSGFLQLAGPPTALRPYRALSDADSAARMWRLAEECLRQSPSRARPAS